MIRKKININTIIMQIIFVFLSVVIIIPVAITFFASFKTPIELGTDFPLKPTLSPSIKNYMVVFGKANIIKGLYNSILLVTLSVLANTLIASGVAFAINRFDFKLKKIYFFLFMLGMLIPPYVTEISRFGIIKLLGLYNTRWSALMIYIAADMMQLYIYLQFIDKIPISLDESAFLDGCSPLRVYWSIILPLVIPATTTLGIFKMVTIMNDMYIPYLYMPANRLSTLTTALMHFSDSRFGSWQNLSAAIVIVMLPSLIAYFMFSKHIHKGLTEGAVKG
ncbi:carbohydrate ABC transporter permease [Oceanispirochaeta crateris]|uniref:Carbohydrate ABC transporter permease n=1 Tax=Oceanispirochaeta crateris TaxID=2518645 RepID=A0A5C1QN41_9SPIO|nr:carbohydrate ABC transporter permease [Oceanispirochaeta crateris]QEN08947.1 carbohydrate ABC transporter permease [Oceanispirochaeta crateris]